MTKYARNFVDTLPFSNTAAKMKLAANTALSYTVPGDDKSIYRVKFRCSATAEVWVALNATAVGPSAGVIASSPNQEFIPLDECRYVKGGDVLSFISSGTPDVGISLLLVQQV